MLFKKTCFAATLVLVLFSPSIGRMFAEEQMTSGNVLFQAVTELAGIPTAQAQAPMSTTATKLFGGILEIFVVVNWLALGVVQALLRPDVLFGALSPTYGVRPMEMILKDIWMFSRDIVNGVFAFILIGAGIMLILKGETNFIKEKAPKFVIAVVLVNFSWFFPRVILDIANILQATIYQIPAAITTQSANQSCESAPGEKCQYVWKVWLFPPKHEDCTANANLQGCPRPRMNDVFPKKGRNLGDFLDIYYIDLNTVRSGGGYSVNNAFIPVSGADTVINGLAVNFAKIPNLAQINLANANFVAGAKDTMKGKAQAYLKFFVYLVFHTMLSIAIGLILIAFAVVLIVRIAVIWLCVAFMPFVFVGMAMGGALGEFPHTGEALGKFNIWKKFVQYAFLPVFVAIPLSIGFILLSKVPIIARFSTEQTMFVEGLGGIITGVNTFHELLWMGMTIGIIWVGTFTVLQSEEYASKIVGGIKGVGQTALKTGVNAVTYTPIAGMPGGSIGGTWDQFKNLPDKMRFRNAAPPPGGTAAAASPTDIANAVATANKPALTEALKNMARIAPASSQQAGVALRKLAEDNITNQNVRDSLPRNRETYEAFVRETKRTGGITADEERKLLEDTNIKKYYNELSSSTNITITVPPTAEDGETLIQTTQKSLEQQLINALNSMNTLTPEQQQEKLVRITREAKNTATDGAQINEIERIANMISASNVNTLKNTIEQITP